MDIDYLLLLQHLRQATMDIFTPFMIFVSDFVISPVPLVFLCLLYWAVDKRVGAWAFMNLAVCSFFNGVLKLTACVYRPWIRDARVIPVPAAKITATGYSFPSGHATFAAVYSGTVFVWQYKHKLLVVAVAIFSVLVLFSRNYLGVHTLQDVLVGYFFSLVVVFALCKLCGLIQKYPLLDILIFSIAIIFATLGTIFIHVKHYPLDYVAGVLVVDPQAMQIDAHKSIGAFVGYFAGWIIERRFINFSTSNKNKWQLALSFACLVLLVVIMVATKVATASLSAPLRVAVQNFVPLLFIMAGAPFVIKHTMPFFAASSR